MIRHVLKDGTEVETIEGRLIKAEDFRQLYDLIGRIQKGNR